MNTELSPYAIAPVINVDTAIAIRNSFVEFVKRLLVEDVDFGKVPGTGSKPTLLKPGAEKLASFFGLSVEFEDVATIEDWLGTAYNGEPFFYYRQRCALNRGAQRVASADGSCNSWEVKYRYRKAERACPICNAVAIMQSKYPPRDQPNAKPGFYCNPKSGGCGGYFPADDQRITEQVIGRVPNTDPAEQVNTILKMAQKRALVAAILIAVNASEFFTQDIEDLASEGEYTVVKATGKVTEKASESRWIDASSQSHVDPLVAKWQQEARKFATAPMPANGQWGATVGVLTELVGGDENRYRFYTLLFGREIVASADLTAAEAAWLQATVKAHKTRDGGWHPSPEAERAVREFWGRQQGGTQEDGEMPTDLLGAAHPQSQYSQGA